MKRKYYIGSVSRDIRVVMNGKVEFADAVNALPISTIDSLENITSKEDFPLCTAGHNMCHDGILQCPECKRANIPQNKPRWIYRDYIKGAFITKVFPTYEECNQYEWAEKRRNGTYLNW